MLNTRLKLNSKATFPAVASLKIQRNNFTDRADTPVSRFSRYYCHERLLMLPMYRRHSTYPQPINAPIGNVRRRHSTMHFSDIPLYTDACPEQLLKMRKDTKFESAGIQITNKKKRYLDVTTIDIDAPVNRLKSVRR